MKRLALGLALLLAAPARADEPPPFMPAPPPPPGRGSVQHARQLRRDARNFGLAGIVIAGAGIAVNVVALDVPQGEQLVRQPDGTSVRQRVLDDANWFELAGGIALTVTGLALITLSLFKLKQAKRLE